MKKRTKGMAKGPKTALSQVKQADKGMKRIETMLTHIRTLVLEADAQYASGHEDQRVLRSMQQEIDRLVKNIDRESQKLNLNLPWMNTLRQELVAKMLVIDELADENIDATYADISNMLLLNRAAVRLEAYMPD